MLDPSLIQRAHEIGEKHGLTGSKQLLHVVHVDGLSRSGQKQIDDAYQAGWQVGRAGWNTPATSQQGIQ